MDNTEKALTAYKRYWPSEPSYREMNFRLENIDKGQITLGMKFDAEVKLSRGGPCTPVIWDFLGLPL